jgi:hypothetical protein
MFIITEYFRSEELINGKGEYSYVEFEEQYRLQFLHKIVKDTVLQHHISRVVESFQTTRSVLKSSGRRQEDQSVVEHVEALIEANDLHKSSNSIHASKS